MGRSDQTPLTDILLDTLIQTLGIGLDIGIRDKGGTHLLVTIHRILLLERSHGVELGIKCRCHLQLVVHKQIDIFLHTFLIDDILAIVLVVGIFKLGAGHIDPCYSHHDWIVALGKNSSKRNNCTESSYDEFLHCLLFTFLPLSVVGS